MFGKIIYLWGILRMIECLKSKIYVHLFGLELTMDREKIVFFPYGII